jgi:putative tryptophan/tyrosine transport system substrate-binding protein
LPEAAGDLVRLNGNAIFAIAPDAVAAARNATTGIPIVALDLESDPLAKRYVKSLACPGGNMTGMFLELPELSGKQVGLLKEIIPRLYRITIFGIPGVYTAQFATTETAARAIALEEVMHMRVADDFELVFEAVRTKHVEARILVVTSRVLLDDGLASALRKREAKRSSVRLDSKNATLYPDFRHRGQPSPEPRGILA